MAEAAAGATVTVGLIWFGWRKRSVITVSLVVVDDKSVRARENANLRRAHAVLP